ncbi:hypothetical protein [Streptomyces agglomeratus]|uniref:hypothetical protein n=1 Tax=Streptomyces agglomeratus TaxID=285458 RepID=UPI002109E3B6|nr:hypothetical protein [Streptomyces agglomeratus]
MSRFFILSPVMWRLIDVATRSNGLGLAAFCSGRVGVDPLIDPPVDDASALTSAAIFQT